MPRTKSPVQSGEFAEFQRFIQTWYERLQPLHPSVSVECYLTSPEPIDLFLGRWDGVKFGETFLQTVNPGQTFNQKLEPITWSSGAKKGDSLMIRVKKNIALYSLKNLEPFSAYGLTATPAVYPWWLPPVQFVRWGPNQPYLIQPLVTINSDLNFTWEDVFYYFQWA
jgi:hypothetical protein